MRETWIAAGWREAIRLAMLLALALGGSLRPAAAGTPPCVEFYDNSGVTGAEWPDNRREPQSTAGLPLVEWGDDLWVRYRNDNFDNEEIVATFQRVDPAGTVTYQFTVPANRRTQAGNRYGVVGLDIGFYCEPGTARADPANWSLGYLQIAKRLTGQTMELENNAGGPISMPRPLLSPGPWRTWADQASTGETIPPADFYVMNPISVRVAGAPPWTADVADCTDPASNYANGNADFPPVLGRRVLRGTPTPALSFGAVSHGRPSQGYVFEICDRSLLKDVTWLQDVPGVRLACRIAHGQMNPTSPTVRTTNMDWYYDLVEYPPVFAEQLTFQRDGGTDDPRVVDMPLPCRASGAAGTYTAVTPVRFQTWVRVPQYQPDTVYGTGWDAIGAQQPTLLLPPALPAGSPSGVPAAPPVRVWVDVDGDQRLDRIDRDGNANTADALRDAGYYPTDTEPLQDAYEVATDGYAEPYREFNLTVGVPTDFRLRVEEPVLDFGKHPANTASTDGFPHAWTVRPITVSNLGNVNLIHLRVAPDTVNLPASSYKRNGYLYSPDTDYDPSPSIDPDLRNRGPGVSIPWPWADPTSGAYPSRKNIWWSFGGEGAPGNPAAWEVTSGGAYQEGTLRKPQAGAGSPSSAGGRWEAAPAAGEPGYVGPRVGVITPFGQPVGDYANQFLVFEDNNANGILDGPDQPAQAPFTMKVSVTDRQLTEEYTAYSLDRPAYGVVGSANPANDHGWSFPTWAYTDAAYDPPRGDGNRYIFSSDTQPAAARFNEPPTTTSHRRLSLYWASNRRDVQPDGSLRTPGPPAGASPAERPQSWYLYSSRSYELMDNAARYWPFWGREPAFNPLATSPTNPPEMKVPGTSLFGASLPNGGKLISEQYTAPYLAQTISTTGATIEPYYLFFQATGHGRGFTSDAAGAPARDTYRASQIYYTQLGSGMTVDPNAQPCIPVGMAQPEVVKHTPRALSYHTVGMQGVPADTHLLWAFWHGGAENAWKGYYNLNIAADKTNAADWRLGDGSGPGVLPLGGDFTTVQDLVPVLYRGPSVDMRTGVPSATTRELIDLYFTAFSKYRRNCDVYTARLDPSVLRYGTRGAWRAKLPFARVERENLSNDNNRNFASQHLEWLTWPYAYATPTRAVFPRIYRYAADGTLLWASPDPTVGGLVNPNTGWTFNQDRYCWTIRYTDAWAQDASGNATDLRGRECTVTVYPMAGVVTFSLPVNEGDRVAADYTPTIMRVAASPQMEASPVAFLDTRYGPAQSAVDGTRTYLYPDGRPISRDRLWLFWTRVAPQVTKPSVWHKTMRLMVQLPYPIRRGQAVSVQDEFGTDITHFTIDTGTAVVDPADPTQDTVLYPGRLYFPTYQSAAAGTARALEGRRVTVTYTNHYTGGAGAQPVDRYIRWRDERPEAPLPIDDVANEGRLCAIPDLAPDLATVGIAEYLRDPGTWRVWLFWTSSRPKATVFNASTGQPVQFSNDTDLRYMTLAPRLDFRSTLP